MENNQETIQISEAHQKLTSVDSQHRVDPDSTTLSSDLHKESVECVHISETKVFAGCKGNKMSANSDSFDQAIDIMTKLTSNDAYLENIYMGVSRKMIVPSHTPDGGEPMTRVPSETSTIVTIHGDDLDGRLTPNEEFKTTQLDSLKSGKLTDEEYELVVHSWNKTDVPYPNDQSVHEIFEAQVVNTPDAIALVHESRTMTYRQLNNHANRFARQLVAADVQRGDNVAIMLERSIELIVSQLAIIKVGAAYVPIDVYAPLDRQMYITSDSDTKLLITDKTREIPVELGVTLLRFCVEDGSTTEDEGNLNLPCSNYDTAYIMYTSGSTGRPKGVMVSHRGIARLSFNNGFSDFVPDDRVAFSSNPSFDPSTFEVWVPLLKGASIVIVDRETFLDPHRLADLILHHQVTFLHMTNALLHQYAFIIGEPLSKLRYLTGAAEQGSIQAYNAVLQHGGPVQVINRYGPTEATVDVTAYTATSYLSNMERLPIGKPVGNARVYVLDKHLLPVPIGVTGELYIGGHGVATGYYNKPDLTAERFLPDPFSNEPGARMYKSGDLVKHLPDGNLIFLGRNDDQVKIRGFRIELGEIEARLSEHAQIREVIVLAVGETSEDKRIVAYVVSDAHEQLPRMLREYLSAILPEYMIPSAFVRMDAFPLTNNGKVDRRALPKPDSESFVTKDYVAPQGETEIALASIWSDLLKIDNVGRHDNFFMLGGHSLLAVRLVNNVSTTLGAQLSLSMLFSTPTLSALAEAMSSKLSHSDASQSVITPISRDGPLELSFAQQRLWFLAQMDGVSDVYYVPTVYRLRGTLDRAALENALYALVVRHETLRTVFMAVDGEPQAQILPADIRVPLVFHDLRQEKDKEVAANHLITQESSSPFDLEKGPLIRAKLIQVADDEHIFLMTQHHIVTDGWSKGIFFRDLSELYGAFCSGQPSTLPPLAIQYSDYAAWQRRWLDGDRIKDQISYWRETLTGAPESITLPTDRPRPPQQSNAGAFVPIHLDAQLTGALNTLSKKHGVTMFMTVLSAWSAILSRLSGQDNVVIGTPTANRNHPQIEQLIGFFVNTLALRIDVSGGPNVEQILERVHKAAVGAQEHQDLPFEQVVEVMQPSRRMDQTPLFQVMFIWQSNEERNLQLHTLEAHAEDTQYDALKFDIELSLSEEDGMVNGNLQYSTALFDQLTMERHAEYLVAMLRWMVINTEQSVDEADILGEAERELVVHSWNKTDVPYPSDQCVHEIFEAQVVNTPDAVALVHESRTMTYRQLNNHANRFARQLVAADVQHGDNVAMMLERSFELIVSQLAIIKVGATYVPIDVKAPLDRQMYITSDSGAKLLIADKTRAIPVELEVTMLRLCVEDDSAADDEGNLGLPCSSSDTAYIMYTSGSTGRPKGVMTPHRAISRLVINSGYADIDANDCVAMAANPAFDAITFEVWAPLVNGGRLVVIDTDTFANPHLLANAITRHGINTMWLTMALFNQYVHTIGYALANLKHLLCGGEQGNLETFEALRQLGGPQHLINGYGPTETTTFAATYEAKSTDDKLERLPIGRPIGNTRLYVLDNYGQPVPVGVVGELYIGGDGVANGYLNLPELTAERFLPDPFSGAPNARMYRSGDLVKHLPDGNLVFLGRNDNQVKIRGFRIELDEIEARLVEHEIIREAVVVVIGSGEHRRLVAYVGADAQDQLAHTLREYLSVILPEYMIPAAYVRMDKLPVTSNGKVDRRGLPEPDSTAFVTRVYVAPQGETEIALASIWSDLLKIDQVGRHDNFFMLGGHSLLAIQLIARLRRLDLTLSVRALFEKPVLSALAASLTNVQDVLVVPPNVITPETTMITPEMLPLIDLTQDDIDRIVARVPGGLANVQDIYGLSPLQDGILFHHLMADKGDTYLQLVCSAFDTRELLDRYLVAFQIVVDRHDIMRTAVMYESMTSPAQVVLRKATLSITELSLDPADGPILDQIKKLYDARQHRISLSEAPLIRFSIAQDVDGRWILAERAHHLIVDHSTLEVLYEEVEAFMEGQGDSLPAPEPYRNVIAQARLGVTEEEHEKFFSKMLSDVDTPSLPYGLSDIYKDGTDATEKHLMLSQELNDTLRGHAQRLGVSLASLCHLAWAQVVAGTSGQSPVVFGTVLFGRMQGGSGSNRALGLFINTLPIRVDVEGSRVVDCVRAVQRDLAALLEHEHASLALAQRCSGVPSGTPLFSTILNYRHNSSIEGTGIVKGMELLSAEERTNYPFTMSVEDYGSSLGVTAQAVHPYEPIKICQYMEQALVSLANALHQSPETFVQELGILPAEEHELVVHSWNKTDAPYPSDQCVHEIFEAQVVNTPDAVALVHESRTMTYRQLNNHANRFARQLVAADVQRGDNVAIMLERSIELIVSQLAIIKVGAAYVPMDVNAPLDRQMYITSDSDTKLLITDKTREIPVELGVTLLRFCVEDGSTTEDQGNLNLPCSNYDTAYIMYTSGSTGRPKGVMVSHRGIARLSFNNGFSDFVPDDRVAFSSNPSFDPSTFEVWVPLLKGASIVIVDRETFLDPHRLADLILHHQVTFLHMTNALLHQYAFIIGEPLSKLRYLTGAAEQGSIEAYNAVLQHGGPVQVINRYGPTEATVDVTAYTATSYLSNMERLPIGGPIGNTRVYVLDKHLLPVPIGVTGELYIGGHGVATGYYNKPDLTAERFLPDPFSNEPGARMYKSGDLVKHLPDGNLIFLGRNDDQVKIRGFRIELGEIEARLSEHAQVREVIVVAVGVTSEDKRIVAYVVSDAHEQLSRMLREYLSAILPEYMIPSAFVRMDAFPLTNNGKVDRRALPKPDSESFVTKDYVAPQGETEIALASIWSDLLKIDNVGRHDNFFMLGGHSLLAIQLIARLRRLDLTLSVRALFEKPVLSALAASLTNHHDTLVVPSNVITPETTMITPEMLPLIDLTQDDIDRIVARVPGGLANVQDIYGLSPLQDGILFHHLMAEKGDTYLQLCCTAFDTRELLDRYLTAFQIVVDRHDIMRTAVMYEGLTSPAQVVLRKATLSITELSLDLADGPILGQIEKLYDTRQHRISLSEAPLIRFSIAQDVDGRWILAERAHHLIVDHSTLEVLYEEIDAFMEGKDDSLPAPEPFRNVIAQARLGVTEEEHEKFFSKMLSDVDTPSLPYGLSDIYKDGTDATEKHLMLSQELNDTLRGHAQRLGVSLASLCHLAWAQVVAGTSGQSPVVFGTVLFGRMQGGSGSNRALGLFINTLPIRVDVEGSRVVDCVRAVQRDLAALLEHEHASLALAQRCSGVPSGTPLFSTLLNYRHNSQSFEEPLAMAGMELLSGGERTNYPFTMSVEDFGSSLGVTAQVVHPYEPIKICQYMEQALVNLANTLHQSPETFVQELGILPAEEHELVVHSWNKTDAPYPSDQCVHEIFEAQVANTPDAVALVHESRTMTYRQLNNHANRFARQLVAADVQRGDNVAIMLERSIELIVSQLAIIKVGAAYVPMDVNAPLDRQMYITSDSDTKLLITDKTRAIPVEFGVTLLRFCVEDGSTTEDQGNLSLSCSNYDTAYIMYTSGSTGRPKGVMVSHRGIARLSFNNGFSDFVPDDRVAFSSNPSFDPSTFEVWVPLLKGASIVIVDRETFLDPHRLADLILHHQVTFLHMTNALLHQYAFIIGEPLSKLRYLTGAAEQGSIEAYNAVLQHGGPVQVINRYGPTEATVDVTAYTATSYLSNMERLPIGKPVGNARVYVLDKHLLPVPIGVTGELYIGGHGVATGYYNKPDLTAERFLPDPFSNEPGARMYKSGDLVKHLPDGNLIFLGRNDDQVKIRGFRIELGEIEARLSEHAQVREVIVVAVGVTSEDKRIVAYVVSDAHEQLSRMLREYLSAILPEYMIPSAFVRMDAFPLTNNGKVDRRALPKPDSESFVTKDYVAPQGETEIALASIWSDLLKIDQVGRHDNFFMLGGHSLLAVRLVNNVSTTLGAQLSLSMLFSTPTLSALAEAMSSKLSHSDASQSVITPISRDGPLELSFAQQRLWFLAQMDGISDVYHVPSAHRLRGTLDRVALKNALGALVARHEALRTVFVAVDGEPQVQLLPADIRVPLVFHDLRQEKDKEVAANHLITQESSSPFDLEKGPLIRARLIQVADDEHIFLITQHHIVTDGWSMGVLFRELSELYGALCNGQPSALPPLAIQYSDYAAWQRRWLDGDRIKNQISYWRETLTGAPESITLPTDRPRPPQQSNASAFTPVYLDAQLTGALNTLSKKHGVTMFMTVLSAWSAILSRLSGQDNVVIGTPTANRNHPQIEQLIGFFVNTLALRIDVSGGPNVEQILERVHKAAVGAQEHQDLPFEQVVEVMQPSRRMDQTPLFQVMFIWQSNEERNLQLHTLEAHSEDTQYDALKFDIELSLSEEDGLVSGGLQYSTALFDQLTMERHAEYLVAMLRWMVINTEQSVDEADILGEAERELVVHSWNKTDVPYPSDQCVHEIFEAQVVNTPDAVALVHESRTMTYRQLNNHANRFARQLVAADVQRGDNIAMMLERSFELVVSQLAIIKVGATYVPIDVKAPLDRQMYIASDSGAKLLIADKTRAIPVELDVTMLRLCVEDDSAADDEGNLGLPCSSSDTAYIMYTSGSTGRPKGVMTPHRAISRLVINSGYADIDANDCVAMAANPAFDAITFEVWAPLVNGGRLVVIDTDTFANPHLLANAIARHGINTMWLTMALFNQYVHTIGYALANLKHLLCGGEQGNLETFEALRQLGGPQHLINGYGPTETTTFAATYEAKSTDDKLERLPIGRPIGNTRLYVLDNYGQPVPVGVVGELYIGGDGVANGYLNLPELTAERFLPDPFSGAPNARMYRSGDLVKHLPDGNLVFLGRNDNQVKIRGFRIELDEIEARLVEHEIIREAVVVVIGSGEHRRLVAYVGADAQDQLAHTLREYLSVILPEYMIPAAYVRMDKLPVTSNGKVDRRGLPEPDSTAFVTRVYVAPQGETEIALASIWSDLLKIDQVGRHDNFFMLGGHSLLAVRLVNNVSTTLGAQLSLSMLFSTPTLSALAEAMSSKLSHSDASQSVITPISRDGPLELSFAQQRLWFLAQMDGISDVYHVPSAHRLRGTLDRVALENALGALVARHEALRTVFVAVDGEPQVQLLPADIRVPLVFHDLRQEKDKEVAANHLITQESSSPFDLEKGPLIRARLIQVADDEHIFLITQHHIVTDGWSMGVLFRELSELYGAFCSGQPSTLPPLAIQYSDYAAWQRRWLDGDRIKEQISYWRETLTGAPESITLPTDRPRPPQQSNVGAYIPIHLDAQLTGALNTLSKKHGVTMFMTVLSAWSAILSRLSGQDNVVIGTPTANRNHPQIEQLIGFFVNTLALRIDVSGGPNVEQILERVHKAAVGAQEHQDLPFEQVVEVMQPSRRMDQTPLFQVMFIWQSNEERNLQLHTLEAHSEDTQYDALKFDIDLSLSEEDGMVNGNLQYSTALFDQLTMERHAEYLVAMLRWMVINTEQSVDEADILGEAERELVVHSWNKTDAPYPSDQCVHEIFEAQVVNTPDAVALVHESRTMTYRQLNNHANRFARQLVAADVQRGDNIAMMLERSFELVVSQLAIIKVGATYVPIDVKAPLDRQMYIASDSGAKLLIADKTRAIPVELDVTMLRLCVEDDSAADDEGNLGLPCSSSDTAYIMYTSGSTGRPKGVMVSHRSIASLIFNERYADVGKEDCIAFINNPAFDASTSDIWGSLLYGARLVVIDNNTFLDPHQLAEALDRYKITILEPTSAIFHQYAFIIGPALSKLKYLVSGGEQGLVEAYAEVLRYGTSVRVLNTYGPTETTVIATMYEADSKIGQLDRVPIGRPISNARLYVLDGHRKPVPVGVTGELYIGGPGVATGYLNLPELTAERFLPDPFSNEPGARMYKSGDLVKHLPDGNLIFLGRNDDQVKIRGFRIELGEIEDRLAEHSQIREVIVLAVGETSEDKRIVAYVVSDTHEQLSRMLREHLSAILPEYMIPSAFVRMDAFPLTNNGKVDRRALPKPDSESFVTKDYVAPQGETEIALASIWSDLLKIDNVGRHDNFFMLGGHSLLAIQLIARLRRLDLTLSVRALFEKPVLSALATSLTNHHDTLVVPSNVITPETTMITPEMLPLIDLTQDDIDRIVARVPGGLANVQDIYGLSPLQDGILFHHLMAEKGDTYLQLLCTAFDTRELLDRYLAAFQNIVDRHDIMRTAVMYEGLTSPAQVVLRKATLSITELSLDPADGPILDQIEKLYDTRQHRISLSEAPLIRFSFAENDDGRWILAERSHHLIVDHSTLEVLYEEIEAFMEGKDDSLPAPEPFRNVIAQARLGVTEEEHEKFFSKMLSDVDTPSLPYGLSDIYKDGADSTEEHLMLSQGLNDTLRGHAQRLGVSLASLCHLAWAQVVAGTSGQSPVVFGTVLFGRMQGGSGSNRALGLFINTLPIRVDVEGSRVVDCVRAVQRDLAALLEHEHASLALAQRCSGVPSGTPLFSTILNYRHNSPSSQEPVAMAGMEVLSVEERTNYPFTMSVEDFGSSLGLTAEAVHPYEPIKICQYMEQALVNLANTLHQAAETFVHELGILPAEEHELVVHSWNKTDAPYPSDQCVHEIFEAQVVNTPDAIALVHESRTMTYRQLNNHANRFARQLVAADVQRGDNIAMMLERSFELVVSQLAIIKVGAAYVPIDVKAPLDRQMYIASDSGAKLLIADKTRVIPVELDVTLLRLCVEDDSTADDEGNLGLPCSSSDTAYIMYTSGSTGRPKGVMVSHRSIASLIFNERYADVGKEDCIAFINNPAFDASTSDIWGSLLYGARLVVIDNNTFLDPHQLAEALDRYKITILEPTSAIFHQYAFIIGPALSKLKYLVSGGEQGLVEAYAEVLRYGTSVRVLNTYGPTETTVIATMYEADSKIGQLDRVPIGRPISNARLYVLDGHRKPVPVGVTGELYIGGPGVATGYLNLPELTAERFLPDPFSNEPGARMYKSGDLVKHLPDGNLIFLGRNDDQVKIRGFRIELGEIEDRLAEHSQIREVIVLAVGETSEDKRIVAYVVSDAHEQLSRMLREYLLTTLPEYMIPSAFVRMDAFPLTNNGKVDRRALPKPDSESFVTKDFVAPQGETEITLASIWSDLLKIDNVGRHDNFFALGGHSLLAVRMISNARSNLGLELTLKMLFTSPTICEIAKSLAQSSLTTAALEDDEFSVLLPLKTQGSRPPLFCIHPGQGLSWSYMGLAKHLHPQQPLYGLQARGLDGVSTMAGSVEEMTKDYLAHVRQIQPHGPYHLLGWSFGGSVAHNMAVELEKLGEKVALLAVMDSVCDYSVCDDGEEEVNEQEEKDYVNHLALFGGKSSIDEGLALQERVMPVSINNSELAARFKPSVFGGDMIFLQAAVRSHDKIALVDPTSWTPYVRGKMEVHDVLCKHLEMDKPENIAVVGAVVAAKLEELF